MLVGRGVLVLVAGLDVLVPAIDVLVGSGVLVAGLDVLVGAGVLEVVGTGVDVVIVGMHTVELLVAEYVPAGQSMHTVELLVAEYIPAAQLVQAV